MKMTPGIGTIANYGSYIKNCTQNQWPYKIPVNNLQDVQLYIAIGSMPDAVEYQLIHTCGPYAGTIETLTTSSYVIGQDTNFDWYGVFKNFNDTANPLNCFVIAITLTFGLTDQIYFSEEYCVETNCGNGGLQLLQGCYGNLDNKLSYDADGIYFGTHAGEGDAMGDITITYKHQLLLRGAEVTLNAIKNTFKQGRTRNFRTEKEKIYQFWGEIIPEWYLPEIDAVFSRGEVFVGETRYLVNDTQFEKLEDCHKGWKPSATFKKSFYQSFSCEADPCAPPEVTCCDVLGAVGSVERIAASGEDSEHNQITVEFTPCEPTPANGYNVQWRVKGTDDAYEDAGNFTDNPAVFIDDTNPEGTEYEGIIRSDCGEVFGAEVPWQTNAEESGSGESGAEPSLINYEYSRSGVGEGQGTIREDGVLKFQNTLGSTYQNGSFVAAVGSEILVFGIAFSGNNVKLVVLNQTDNIEEYNHVAAGGLSYSFNPVAGKTYLITILINYS